MKEVTDFQKRRAVNIIWNAARDYGFQPDFKVYDDQGQADLYWNTIVGAVRRHYDYSKLEPVFLSFQDYEDSDTYEGLLWLGLENCVYLKEVGERPALKDLRRDYAEKIVSSISPVTQDDLLSNLEWAHYNRVLGNDVRMNGYDRKLLDDLEFSPDLDTDQIVEKAGELFMQWFQINTEYHKRKKKEFHLKDFLMGKRSSSGTKKRYRRFGLGFADHPKNIYGGSAAGQDRDFHMPLTKMTDEELYDFMQGKFGKDLYSSEQRRALERQVCTGNHQNCHLLITKGEVSAEKIENGFEALQKQREAAQVVKNREYYEADKVRNRIAIARLTSKIQNSVLLHLTPSPVRADTGKLKGKFVWQALYTNEHRIFEKTEQDSTGDLSVDILLDASTSQKSRQEIVSTQGYLIAESLKRCGIPYRVMSFCSMTGYTILHIFNDYNEPNRNDRIFDYVSNGCNRDGLAIRAAHHLMNHSTYDHKILIILSDVKPNDVVQIPGNGQREQIPYEDQAGLQDVATEVRRARADRISVICVFTGEDEDVASAKLVYGQDFARIRSIDQMADTVGKLLQNQIRNL